MPTRREEMQNLGDEIVHSYEDRISGIARVKEVEAERKRTAVQEISDVGAMLKGFDDVHATMSKELRADLAGVARILGQAEAERKRTAAQEISDLGAKFKEFRSDVGAMLKEFREEQAGARNEWQKMIATMQYKRSGTALAVKPPVEATSEAATETTPETVALRQQVFEYLAGYPDGTKLAQIAQEFRVARIQIGKVVRELIDENKVEKRDLLYFVV